MNKPPPGCVLKRKLNKHVVGRKHIRGDTIFINSEYCVVNTRLATPVSFNLPRVNTVVHFPDQQNSAHPPQEDFGDDGAYDDYSESMEIEAEAKEVEEELNTFGIHSDNEEDDGEHLSGREEPVDDDDTNLAELMAQNSLDDTFCVSDLTKDVNGKYYDHGIEPILPKVIIMVRKLFVFVLRCVCLIVFFIVGRIYRPFFRENGT
jgi:hypothetical protein